MMAVVDVADLPLVEGVNWFADPVRDSGLFYATRTVRIDGKRRAIRMHNVIASGHKQVDHRDGNGLNNRRRNLRPCVEDGDNQANSRRPINNSSGFKGVVRTRSGKPWAAQIQVGGRNIYLGRFDDRVTAAWAYDIAAVAHFGEFASRNFPGQPVPPEFVPAPKKQYRPRAKAAPLPAPGEPDHCHAAVLLELANPETAASDPVEQEQGSLP